MPREDRIYLQHGRRHLGNVGTDPVYCDWYLLTLLNGWTDIGGGIPTARWCMLPGVDPVSGDPKIELKLAVSSGTPGSVITNLGITFSADHPVFFVYDGTGTPHPVQLLANGDLIDAA